MMKRVAIAVGSVVGVLVLAGCVPVAVGAVGAVAVDSASEDRGKDLF
jgi:hypothetical protein